MKTLAYVAWFASACALAFGQNNKNSSNTGALSAADLTAIRSANEAYRTTCLAQAWSKWANLFTTDAIMMPPNSAAITGRAALEAWIRAFPPVREFQNPIAEIDGSGSLAIVRGTFALVMTPPNAPEQRDAGKWTCTLRKQADGTWKFHRCIFNSDMPLSAAMVTSPPAVVTAPNIAGTYKLVSRKLPDGRLIRPPAINGLYSITATTINFNIVETAAGGKTVSGSSFSNYRLSGKELVQTSLFSLLVEDGKTVSANHTPRTETLPVKMSGTRIEFTPPPWISGISSPLHVFDGNTLVASKAGEFVDTWERIDAAPAGESPDAIMASITTALNAGLDAASARDPRAFAIFSPTPDVRFATEGTTPTVAEFRKEWDDEMKRVSQQHLQDREHIVQVLSSEIAISTTRAKYSNADANGAASDSVPFAFTAVWQRQTGGWRIVNAHQSVMGGWPTSSESVTTAVKAAVEKHWAAINGNDTVSVDRQHTAGISMFLADIEPRMRLNSPAWLGLLQRWQGAKTNWTPREIEVQPLSATVAVASFHMEGSVRWPDGSADTRPRRVTEIWVNDNGTWKEAHHHDSVFAPAGKPAAAQ